MYKLKTIGRLAVSFILVMFLTAGVFVTAGNVRASVAEAASPIAEIAETSADEMSVESIDGPLEIPEEIVETPETQSEDDGMRLLVEGLLSRLKAMYGDRYEEYYNAILAEWGSVEEYILSMVGEEEDPAANFWRNTLSWIDEYSYIWGSVLAVVACITFLIVGKVAFSKLMQWLNGRKKGLYSGMNKVYESQIALGRAVLKLLGNGPQTEAERKAISDAIEHLKAEDADE